MLISNQKGHLPKFELLYQTVHLRENNFSLPKTSRNTKCVTTCHCSHDRFFFCVTSPSQEFLDTEWLREWMCNNYFKLSGMAQGQGSWCRHRWLLTFNGGKPHGKYGPMMAYDRYTYTCNDYFHSGNLENFQPAIFVWRINIGL